MIVLFTSAAAQDLPWECTTITAPADARPYADAVEDETTGVDLAAAAALALAEAWVDTSCLTDCGTSGSETCWTGACVTGSGAWVEYDMRSWDDSGSFSAWSSETHIVVEPPGTEAWTRLDVRVEETTTTYSGTSGSSADRWEVAWEGVVDADWPVDGGFTAEVSRSYASEGETRGVEWDDGTCAWSAVSSLHLSYEVIVGTTQVEVSSELDHCMGYFPVNAIATMDGVLVGFVEQVTWEPTDDNDGDRHTELLDCDDTDASVYWCAPETPYDGIDQDCSDGDLTDADRDDHEGIAAGGDDCDDTDDDVYPGAADAWYDGIDSDCAGDDDYDQDLDGFGTDDCDDADASVYPGAVDTWYDGIDSDCAGNDDSDQDADGFGVDDCDDTDASVFPGAVDSWYDGIDSDCAGDDDYDQDADGYTSDDCDDTDASVYPDAVDTWYDGIDSDCVGDDDFDQDADGYTSDDCDDTDPTVYPGAADAWYDGVDSDCAGDDDFDQDLDGYTSDDCDDTDPTIHPGAADAWYDGIDSDCAGNDDYDQDLDGYTSDDCDDADSSVNPGATDIPDDGVDADCSGSDASTAPEEVEDTGCNAAPGAPWLAVFGVVAFRRTARRSRR